MSTRCIYGRPPPMASTPYQTLNAHKDAYVFNFLRHVFSSLFSQVITNTSKFRHQTLLLSASTEQCIMPYQDARRRLKTYFYNFFHPRTPLGPSNSEGIGRIVQLSESVGSLSASANNHHGHQRPTINPQRPSSVTPGTGTVDLGRPYYIFLAPDSSESVPDSYHTRVSVELEDGDPDILDDLAQAPLVSDEVRMVGLMVEPERFGIAVWRILEIWIDFNAADAGSYILCTYSGICYC